MKPVDSWRKARITLSLCTLVAVAWLIESALVLEVRAALWGGFIPARVTMPYDGSSAPVWLTPLTANLVHGGLVHVAFNVAALAFAGRRVENVLGPVGLAILYVVGAFAAAGADYLVVPQGELPMIGAGGGVSAVVGAYAILFCRNRLGALRGRIAVWLNALWVLATLVVLTAMVAIAAAGSARGYFGLPLAISAAIHTAGFVFGVLLANPLLLFRYRKA